MIDFNKPRLSITYRREKNCETRAAALLLAVEALKDPEVESVSVAFTEGGSHQYLSMRTDHFVTVAKSAVQK